MNNFEPNIQDAISLYWEKTAEKFSAEVRRIGFSIPYVPVDGKYEDMGDKNISYWTNGFWPGILWLMYNWSGDMIYRETAESVEKRLDQAFHDFIGIHHDVGFMWLLSSVANYRITGNKSSMARGLHAATILAGRYNPRGKFIRSWNEDKTGWVIVDSLMNLPLLHWAAQITGDPRFTFIAEDHAQTVLRTIVREDGSCNHIAVLDPTNGNILELPGGQGYSEGSAWSRGQAWAIYGFALSYRYTKNEVYKETSKKIADYFISQIESTEFIPALDFRAPETPQYWDTTAGTCAACGILELADFCTGDDKERYKAVAWKMINNISEKYCNWNPEEDSLVSYGSIGYYRENLHTPIIFGDYYYVEALLRLQGKAIHLW